MLTLNFHSNQLRLILLLLRPRLSSLNTFLVRPLSKLPADTRLFERIEAQNLFSTLEAEEQAKKEFAKIFVTKEVQSTPKIPKEKQTLKTVAPTPEQIIAIKVNAN
ncbi:hypothetical protein NMG60_11033569 [Bertholletia excelsa]